jgi:hypothetical protein
MCGRWAQPPQPPVELDLSVEDTITRSVMLQTIRQRSSHQRAPQDGAAADVVPPLLAGADPELHDIVELRSRDRDRIRRVLRHDEGARSLVPHIVPLLAWEPVADVPCSH